MAQSILGTSASVIGMIPEGLVLLTAVALATGSYNLSKRNILVRSLSAIETLARVDTLCLDKTGTITTGKLTVKKTLTYGNMDTKEVLLPGLFERIGMEGSCYTLEYGEYN